MAIRTQDVACLLLFIARAQPVAVVVVVLVVEVVAAACHWLGCHKRAGLGDN